MPFGMKKLEYAWLPDGEIISKISLFVSTECTNVMDGQTHRRTDGHRMTAYRPRLCIASRQKSDSICQSYAQVKKGPVF